MTKSEKRGKQKLAKRATNGDIVLSKSDKSTEITISSMESCIQQGEIIVSKDTPSNWNEVQKTIKVTVCHSIALTKAFNMIKREKQRMKKASEQSYIGASKNHHHRIGFLETKLKRNNDKPLEVVRREEIQALQEEWLDKITSTTDPPRLPQASSQN